MVFLSACSVPLSGALSTTQSLRTPQQQADIAKQEATLAKQREELARLKKEDAELTLQEKKKEEDSKEGFTAKCQEEVSKVKAGSLGKMPPFSEAMIKSSFEYTLNDPFSARYKISKPRRGIIGCGVSSVPKGAWMVSALINAKNKFGAYTGWTPFMLTWFEADKKWSDALFNLDATIHGSLYKLSQEEAKALYIKTIYWVDS